MPEFEFVINFFKDSAHLKEVGTAVTLCGIPVGGWFIKKFISISQMGGKRGCQDCVHKAGQKMMEDKR